MHLAAVSMLGLALQQGYPPETSPPQPALSLNVEVRQITGDEVTFQVNVVNNGWGHARLDPLVLTGWCKIFFSNPKGERVHYEKELMGSSLPDYSAYPILLLPDHTYGLTWKFKLINPPRRIFVTAMLKYPKFKSTPEGMWTGSLRSPLTVVR